MVHEKDKPLYRQLIHIRPYGPDVATVAVVQCEVSLTAQLTAVVATTAQVETLTVKQAQGKHTIRSHATFRIMRFHVGRFDVHFSVD